MQGFDLKAQQMSGSDDESVLTTASREPAATTHVLLISGSGGGVGTLRADVLNRIGSAFNISMIVGGSSANAVPRDFCYIPVLLEPTLHDFISATAVGPNALPAVVISSAVGDFASGAVLQRLGIAAYISPENLDTLQGVLAEIAAAGSKPEQSNEAIPRESIDSLREGQRLITIGKLAAEIAHEINNPLEAVGNLLYLAQAEAGLSPRAVDYLRDAEKELGRVVQITRQTLSFYRESSLPMKIEMSSLMDEVVSLYGRRLNQKGVELIREYSNAGRVTALPGEIRQVLSNLVTNAIEASTDGGKIHLRIRDGRQWSSTGSIPGLRISVADEGSGIPEAARKRLGELFFTTKGQSGTGLGLWVTKAIVTRYGGSMRLKSSTGEMHGTVFNVFLPFTDEHRLDAAPVENRESKAAPISSKRDNVTEISNHPSHYENLAVPYRQFKQVGQNDIDGQQRRG